MRSRLIVPMLTVALLAGGCLPAALEDATPDAAVVGVPVDAPAPGAADGLDARLRDLDTGHDLVARSSLAFLEARSGLVGSRALPGAARIARSTGAEIAVAIEASTLSREIDDPDRSPTERAVVQLEAVLLRAADAEELARLAGPRTSGERRLADATLPPVAEDPLIAELVSDGLDALAPRVARELRALAADGARDGEHATDRALNGSSAE